MKNIRDYSTRRIYRAIKRRIVNIPHYLAWHMPFKLSKNNKMRLLSLENKHVGQRCFILANGPSLRKVDLSLLKDEVTIGMNRVYLLKKEIGFEPTYLCVSDIDVQLKQFSNEYGQFNVTKFFEWNSRNIFKNQDHIIYFKQAYKLKFQENLLKPVGGGKSVTFFCIQLAYYMGFDEVILIGKDHKYNIEGKPGDYIVSDGKENNHFIKGYYKTNQRWRVPNYADEEISYELSRKAFEKSGRKIVDATVGGNLTVFEKVNYLSLFNK